MRGLIYSAAMLFCAAPAFAQQGGGVVQSGSVTAGDCVSWKSTNIIQDAGAACGGGSSTLTANSTATSGFTSGQYLYSDGSKLQSGSFGANVQTALASALNGSGAVSATTSPTFVTPILGVASATTLNKVALTAPATGSTLTIADGKTLTVSNTLTLTGTDSSTLAIGAGGTLTTAAFTAIGTSGATIPLLSTANTWATVQNMFSGVTLGTDTHFLYEVNSTTIGIRIGAAGPYFNIRTVAGSNMDFNNASAGNVTFSSGGTLLATVNTSGNVAATSYTANGTAGVTCAAGISAITGRAVNGIITAC